ncbi:DMT family transporter [Pseudorhodoplanes sp.]|jgi:drug/metabolite transporter (DMT)-like permease|uniref:DMT family transporter n=1 Tax=Pseudorhodoplanes sp. TaxID=1934341 RepID=UPI002C83D516|nr:DMT family transporter [Pseudorhodoplanes sp.]HWV41239.1 DMT family transporter [Pseudorhodoplanes sp.]
MARVLGRFGGWLNQQAYLLVCLTYLMWSLNIVLGRHIAGVIPPVTLGFIRWAIGAVILLPFAWPYLKRDWPAIRSHIPILSLLGVTGTTGYAIPSYWGLQYTLAINGLLIQCTMPMVIGLMSYLLVGDRLNRWQVVGIVVSFIGVVVILTRGDPDVLHSISFNRGDLWFLLAMLIFALYSPLLRKRPAIHPISFLAITAILGTLWVLPLVAWEVSHLGIPSFDAHRIAVVMYMAIFPSLIAYICYNRGVQLLGPNPVAALYPLIIVFGSIQAMLFLGEVPQWFHFVGTVFIVGGVLLATRMAAGAKPAA